MADHEHMLELRLKSGAVVAFDGRILEVFEAGPGRRFHVATLPAPLITQHADGGQTVALEDGSLSLRFARAEVPACTQLLVALAAARSAGLP